jgi:aspartokinase
VHSLVEETDCVKAVSGTSGEALITLVGTILDSPGKMIPKILDLLASRGIMARDINTSPSTVGILVDWERRLEALDSLENREWSN